MGEPPYCESLLIALNSIFCLFQVLRFFVQLKGKVHLPSRRVRKILDGIIIFSGSIAVVVITMPVISLRSRQVMYNYFACGYIILLLIGSNKYGVTLLYDLARGKHTESMLSWSLHRLIKVIRLLQLLGLCTMTVGLVDVFEYPGYTYPIYQVCVSSAERALEMGALLLLMYVMGRTAHNVSSSLVYDKLKFSDGKLVYSNNNNNNNNNSRIFSMTRISHKVDGGGGAGGGLSPPLTPTAGDIISSPRSRITSANVTSNSPNPGTLLSLENKSATTLQPQQPQQQQQRKSLQIKRPLAIPPMKKLVLINSPQSPRCSFQSPRSQIVVLGQPSLPGLLSATTLSENLPVFSPRNRSDPFGFISPKSSSILSPFQYQDEVNQDKKRMVGDEFSDEESSFEEKKEVEGGGNSFYEEKKEMVGGEYHYRRTSIIVHSPNHQSESLWKKHMKYDMSSPTLQNKLVSTTGRHSSLSSVPRKITPFPPVPPLTGHVKKEWKHSSLNQKRPILPTDNLMPPSVQLSPLFSITIPGGGNSGGGGGGNSGDDGGVRDDGGGGENSGGGGGGSSDDGGGGVGGGEEGGGGGGDNGINTIVTPSSNTITTSTTTGLVLTVTPIENEKATTCDVERPLPDG